MGKLYCSWQLGSTETNWDANSSSTLHIHAKIQEMNVCDDTQWAEQRGVKGIFTLPLVYDS